MATRPQLLYVANGIPHVPAPGGPTRAFHLVRAAADVGAVTLVAVEGDATAEPAAIAGSCDRIVTVPAPPPAATGAPPGTRSDHDQGPNGGAPSVLWRFDPRPLQATVGDLLRTGRFDLVVVEHTELAAALAPLLRRRDGPALADLHNVLSVHQMRVAQLRSPDGDEERKVLCLADRHAVQHIQAIERDILRCYSRVTAVSDVDACHLRRLVADAPVRVVPNGVDADYFSFGAAPCRGESPPERLVFTGALWYRPNVDGLRYFLTEIWPTVRARRPRVRLSIVGARPGADVRLLAEQPGIELHASVADVRPFLAASAAAVVPLRLGSGTRLKILEALAAGRPVVSTTVGAEGLALEPGRDILLADDPAHFAEAAVRLLAQPAYARSLANRGRETVRRRYDWSVVVAHFRDVLAEALRMGRGACTRTTTG